MVENEAVSIPTTHEAHFPTRLKALITGVTGQDGHYLSQFLRRKGYEVYGLVRRTAQSKTCPEKITLVDGDVTDPGIVHLVEDIRPDEIYHLAAMSHVGESFSVPRTTFEINAIGTLNVLEAANRLGCKFYQASTSELFGASPPPQNETTAFYPRSPYGIAKLAAYWTTVNYREAYGLYACNGILFNHESPYRGNTFVTQKVCQYVAALQCFGAQGSLKLGNLDAKRDWGHAADFVRGMWMIMQQPDPGDYVLATGKSRSVRDLLDVAFAVIGIEDWTPYVVTDPNLYRPADVDCLIGDASKAKAIGWEPEITFETMIGEMVETAIEHCRKYGIAARHSYVG